MLAFKTILNNSWQVFHMFHSTTDVWLMPEQASKNGYPSEKRGHTS